jgi:hypothetical protein
MINYILQVMLFQAVFFAVYEMILKKETFFQWNRAYLILTAAAAYVIPLIDLQSMSNKLPAEYFFMMPEVILSPEEFIEKQFTWSEFLTTSLPWIFLAGILLTGILFTIKIFNLHMLINRNIKEKNKDYNLVLLQVENTAFSFFKFIFIGKTLESREKIIRHEMIHVRQWHSLDLLFFEIQKIIFWFNPYSYLYQNRITEIHEFIADSGSVSKKEGSTFFNSLLAETFQVDKMAFVNSFNNHSLIKKRIIMFNREHSKDLFKIKYALLIPLFLGMLTYTSCQKKSSKTGEVKGSLKIISEDSKIEHALGSENKNEVVPFALIEKAPVYPGCEDAEDQKKCMIENIAAHVSKNFDASISDKLAKENAEETDPSEDQLVDKVYVQFTIDKQGLVTDLKARAKHEAMEKEAIRVVSSLPQFIPGEENGKKVAVKFTLPISLKD